MTMNKRKLVMDSNKHMLNYVEIIPGQLVFVTFKRDVKPSSNKHRTYLRVDNFLHYEGFYNDFGPYNICNLYHYCKYLNLELEAAKKANNRLVVQYVWMDKEKRLNSAFAIGAYAIIYLNRTADEVYKILTSNETQIYSKFNDASAVLSDYKLSLHDCLRAVEKSFKYGFFNFDDFNYLEYEHYEIVESGDLNWILPNKFIAFCGPHSISGIDNKGYTHHSPDKYFEYFRKNNVTTIVRLNYKFYDAQNFTDAGFTHYDLIFRDGSTPSDSILNQFIEICERTDGAVAVHCKAGLGRTGSLIGAYMMKHYRLTAMETIAWIRLCRPGSVIGHQQAWMEEKQLSLWVQGEAYRRENKIKLLPSHEIGVYSYKNHSCLDNTLIEAKMVQTSDNIDGVDTEDDDETQTENIDDIIGEIQEKTRKRSRSVTGISEKVDTMKLDDANGNLVKTNDKNGNIITSGTSSTVSKIAKSRGLAALAKKKSSTVGAGGAASTAAGVNTLPTKLPSSLVNSGNGDTPDQITQGDELNQIKFRRHHRSITVAVPQTEAIPKLARCYHSRAKSQSSTRSPDHHDTTTTIVLSSSSLSPTKSSLAKNVNTRIAYVVVTSANSTSPPTSKTHESSMSHIPTITSNSNSKLIKSNKQSKDEVTTKRASVRRAAIGRTKLSRSPVKAVTTTTTSHTSANVTNVAPVTTTASATTISSLDDILGPITRSRMCRFCTTTTTPVEDNGNDLNYKRGKRSLSSTRFYDKKNKLSRKNQILVPTLNGGATVTRRLRKEASLDSALADVAAADNDAKDDLSLQEPPTSLTFSVTKEPPKSRLKKPTIRATSQKALPTLGN